MTQRAALRWTASIDLIYVDLGIRASYRGGILYLGPYYCVESCLTYAFMIGLDISSYEAQDPICFCGHILYVLVPVLVVTDFKSKLLCMIYCLKNLAM